MRKNVHIFLLLAWVFFRLLPKLVIASEFDLAETAGTMRIWHGTDGLPSDSVTAILQTRDGFLWVGTSGGLTRFDGVKFTAFTFTNSVTNLPVRVTALCEDSDGHLWIGTQREGLFKLSEGKLRRFNTHQGLLDEGVTSLAADRRGAVWIGTKSGLNLWTGQEIKSFTVADGLPDALVSGVNVARPGTVWITTRTGMSRFIDGRITQYEFQTESEGRSPEYLGAYEDRQGNLWAFGDTYLINLTERKRFNYFRSSESASVRIWSLCEGRDGRLWIGTSGRGLFCFEDNRFQPVILGESRWPYDVRAICEDREGNLWLGTSGGGLVQLRTQSVHILRAGQGLPNSLPATLAPDASGRMYVGLERGGLYIGESGHFDHIGGGDGLEVQNHVSSVCVAHDGAVWAGTLGNGLYSLKDGREAHFTTANGLADDVVLAVCADAQGAVWSATQGGAIQRLVEGVLTHFDTNSGLPGTTVTALTSSIKDRIWLGTQNGQILRGRDGRFSPVVTAKNFGHHAVLSLFEGEQGRLWIGTDGGGLQCVVGDTGMSWNISNGLPNDIVAGIVEDRAKNLWIATGSGIYRINRDDVHKALETPDSLIMCKLMSGAKTSPESELASGGTRAALSPDGELWFATSDGLLNVDTRQSDGERSAFPIYIESAAFNGGPPINLLHGSLWSSQATNVPTFPAPVDLRSLEIHFTGLNLTAPGDLRFRHKLDGFDPDWVDDAVTRYVRYGRLPYGHYQFYAAARTRDGKWEDAAEPFAFVVPTPLYSQTWMICLYGVSAIALIAGIVRVISHRRLRFTLARLEQQQSLERERMRIARDMHDEMGSKLTKISFLSERAQVEINGTGPLADKIQSISQTSRELLQTMDEIVWVVNPRNDTLDNLVAYLSHYAMEYFQNTNVECELQLPPEVPHYPLSSELRHNLFLTFEEALNNVLKHSGATNVKVEMALSGLDFELKVTDNGRGFEVPPVPVADLEESAGPGGNGLKNIRQRMLAIGGQGLIVSQPGAGTVLTMRIRLNKKIAGEK